MNNINSSATLSQILNQQLDLAVALADDNHHNILYYNHKFCQRCIGELPDSPITLEQVIPKLNIEILNKALKRHSVYRFSVNYQQQEKLHPVDFRFSTINIEGSSYILIQGQDNPQSLELKNMINSYDAIFKAQTKELKEEKQKSQQANDFKAQFLSRISHELRTPMNAILGFAQLQDIALKGQNNLQQHNQHILNAGYDIIELLDKMFEFVELDNHDTQINITTCSLHHHLIEAIEKVNKRLRNHHILLNYPNMDFEVKADPRKLTHILQELISNGIKFNDPGGKLNIELCSNLDNTVELAFKTEVSNIEDDEITQLFTPFFRSQYAKDNEISGIGIGLVLSQHHANLMNANIHISRDKNFGGIIVYLTLTTADND